ncbi:E3 ubiquitin-protein ligase [Quillaja saponaria]|uniref:E3 ubiquitin-protein ligase n=1 Tax=Quillaja saponaria TaxID=32244 RepID=A0AAD7PE72_QUISA|nr:E3 ubiquitin-protein ligase [Quillaja saponaria]
MLMLCQAHLNLLEGIWHKHEYQTSGGTQVSTYSFTSRGGAGHGHGQSLRIWFYNFKLVLCLSEIIASVVVLSLSRNENPHAPLFAWLVVYAFVDVAALPIRIYSRYRNRNQGTDNNNNPESINQVSVRRNHNTPLAFSSRLNGLVNNFSMALDCFLHVWFVVGTVWIFGGHSSASDAPKICRLCVVFLAIGYFFVCLGICNILWLLVTLHYLGTGLGRIILKLDRQHKNPLMLRHHPTSSNRRKIMLMNNLTQEYTKVEFLQQVCCICLAKYEDGDDLRELPCCHVFHVVCVNKWLKMRPFCPLCESVVSRSLGVSTLAIQVEIR